MTVNLYKIWKNEPSLRTYAIISIENLNIIFQHLGVANGKISRN